MKKPEKHKSLFHCISIIYNEPLNQSNTWTQSTAASNLTDNSLMVENKKKLITD